MIVLHATHDGGGQLGLQAGVPQRNGVDQVGCQARAPLLQADLIQQSRLLVEEGHHLVIDIGTNRDTLDADRRPRLDLVGATFLYLGHE